MFIENLIKKLFKGSQPEIAKEPLFEKPRFPCPFYGFHKGFENFMDQDGNQCPLTNHTCLMEYFSSGPDWKKCSFNCERNKEKLNFIFDRYKIFPNEFWPTDQSKWNGIPIRVWMAYVMNPSTSRPITLDKSKTPTGRRENPIMIEEI